MFLVPVQVPSQFAQYNNVAGFPQAPSTSISPVHSPLSWSPDQSGALKMLCDAALHESTKHLDGMKCDGHLKAVKSEPVSQLSTQTIYPPSSPPPSLASDAGSDPASEASEPVSEVSYRNTDHTDHTDDSRLLVGDDETSDEAGMDSDTEVGPSPVNTEPDLKAANYSQAMLMFKDDLIRQRKYNDQRRRELGIGFTWVNPDRKGACRCLTCDKEFQFRRDFKAHAHLHFPYKPFRCMFCSNEFTFLPTLRRHGSSNCKVLKQKQRVAKQQNLIEFADSPEFEASVELQKAELDAALDAAGIRMVSHDRWLSKCTQCEQLLGYGTCFTKHAAMHLPAKPFHCIRCQRRFHVANALIDHARRDHQSGSD